MKPEALAELVRSGNAKTAEDMWMNLIDAPDLSPAQLSSYDVVLRELAKAGRAEAGAQLAWAAIESLSSKVSPLEALEFASPFLLAVGDGDELRGQVLSLYESAHADREGLASLLEEAGLGGGRPVRRALRTLDVCLKLSEGDFLAERDDLGAARVETIDRDEWQIAITGPDGAETLGAVHLADRFAPADASTFRVMRQFQPDALHKRMSSDPASVILELCQANGGKLDSHELEEILIPAVFSEADWKKWWTKARAAIRRCAKLEIEGRSPYFMTYVETPATLESEVAEDFRRVRESGLQFTVVEKYLRECKARTISPDGNMLRDFAQHFVDRAKRLGENNAGEAGRCWLMARCVAEMGAVEGLADGAAEFINSLGDLPGLFGILNHDGLMACACDCLVESRPDDWPELLLSLLPLHPQSLCDRTVGRILEAGRDPSDVDPVLQEILVSPVEYFDALLWLWNGPADEAKLRMPSPESIVSRIIRALDDARRSDTISSEVARKIGSRGRAVLSARSYERFESCLEGLSSGMANTLFNRMRQSDSLGRAVREDMISRLRRRFPLEKGQAPTPPWEREDVLFVTVEGLRAKQNEIEHHVNVKMKENSIAIGNAAERGDLSENSEYKFALEERDLLRARLGQMNEEVAMAIILAPEEVVTDHVNIGTKVTFRSLSGGADYKLTFLGPWEADIENNKLNYLTPLAKKVLGKTIGDTVEFDHTAAKGEFTISAIENALVDTF